MSFFALLKSKQGLAVHWHANIGIAEGPGGFNVGCVEVGSTEVISHEVFLSLTTRPKCRIRTDTNAKGECLLIYLGREDLISSLKRFKSYAKQELLAADLTSHPETTRAMAQARKDEYERLIQVVMDKGVSSAYDEASTAYKELKARLSIYKADNRRDTIKKLSASDLSIAGRSWP